jgi:Na+-driven multidrug efflux pump
MYFVGQSASSGTTLALAAMSVNGAIFNIIAAVTTPLCTGTTAVVSRILASSSPCKYQESTEVTQLGSVLVNGLFLAFSMGCLSAAILQLFGGIILSKGFGLQAESLKVAGRYLRIRASALPFALVTYVVIGFSLGMQNAVTPVRSLAISSLINIAGDFILVKGMGWGLEGAAWATGAATILAALITSRELVLNYFGLNSKESILATLQRMLRQLQPQHLQEFFSTSGLLFCGSFVNTLTYSSGARVSSFRRPGDGLIQVAAHQVVMQLWWFISYFSSSNSLAAQAILPKEVKAGQANAARARAATKMLLRIAGGVAIFCSACVALVLRQPSIFSADPLVQMAVRSVNKEAVVSMFIICITTALDGIFIGYDKLAQYIGASVLATCSAWGYYQLYAMPTGRGLRGAWEGILIFSVARLIFYLVSAGAWKFRTQKQQASLPKVIELSSK